MSNFDVVKRAVAAQWNRIQKHSLFRVDINRDELWSTYLTSFPPGANPILRERTEHDCSACRSFIRTVGDVVAVIDGEVVSLWDVEISETRPMYGPVCAALSALVKSKPIIEPFLHYESVAGIDRTFEQRTDADKSVKTWTHFFVNIDRRFVMKKADIPTSLSEKRSSHDVFLRSLHEISDEAIETVLDLIAQNSLYRGAEHKELVDQFRQVKARFTKLPDERSQDLFAWTSEAWGALARIRNTVIGTLLVDLSEGKDLEDAVRSFEAKVAPTNYKRPSALVTPSMIAKAKEKINELGLMSALDRRYATIRDISVENVLFADRAARKAIAGDVFDDLVRSGAVKIPAKNLDKVEEIPIDRFIADVLPRIDSLEVLFENRHAGNLVSLIAPMDPTALPLFKWDNGFSWSYAGELADAIKERVKRAGGNVTGDLCCRLAWRNYDDLDLHMVEPTRYHIFYGNRSTTSTSGGRLDVDMNVIPTTREPVENIFYASRSTMLDGEYHLYVHQYNARESNDVGFEVEMDYLGTVYRFTYEKPIRTGSQVTVARFHYSRKNGLEILESLPSSQATRTLWNLPTQTYHRVSTLMMSPNYWQRGDNDPSGASGIGNRHFFFMIDGARNDGSARGFFNEFLKEDLTPHRKVFEIVGAKMRPENTEDQLSGLGFSSTRHDTVICRVKGSFTRTLKIVF